MTDNFIEMFQSDSVYIDTMNITSRYKTISPSSSSSRMCIVVTSSVVVYFGRNFNGRRTAIKTAMH